MKNHRSSATAAAIFTKQHYIFLGLLTLLFLCCQFGPFQGLMQWMQDTLFNLFLIYAAWNVSYFIYSLDWITKERVDPKGKAVMITGCDSGFGLALAQQLDSQGYKVFAACLSIDSDGAKKLRERNGVTVVPMDVTNDASVREARAKIDDWLRKHPAIGLWAVVNNAGIMSLCEIEFGDMSVFQRQVEVNGIGVIRVTKQFLPLLRHNGLGRGRIINMASLAGRFTMPGFVAYCISKAMVIAFSDGLRRELAKWNIDVVSIEPHLYRTNLVNQQRLMDEFQSHWNQTEESIRKDYGRSYHEGFVRTMTTAMDTARDEIQQVVATMNDAVTLVQVQNYYIVCRLSERIRIWFWATLAPVQLIDFFMRKFLTDCNGQPKFLADQKLRSANFKNE